MAPGSPPASGKAQTPAPGASAVRPFGKYFLVRKLAEGGMAEIFLAKQVGAEGFERNVVIKRMLQHLSGVPDFVGMFLDEARLAARLSHQNIIQINDLGLTDGCYFICMEYLGGEDLSTVLRTAARRREYVPMHVVLRVVADAAHGLHFAHDFTDEGGRPLNIVHRDISPSNIYVTYQGQVKLLDFGIAKAESRVTNTTAGVVKGKYMYMAPEQAKGEPLDRRADVFSLGVSLYEGLTNVRPFAHENDLAILNAVLKCDFRRPTQVRPDLPQELEGIILKAMAQKREARYQSAQEMAADLEQYLAQISSDSRGAAVVGQYLRGLFGEDRFKNKTRIPTLANLAQSGVDVPGFSNPYTPMTELDGTRASSRPGPDEATSAIRRRVVPGWRRKTVALLFFSVAAALAAGGYFLHLRLSASPTTSPLLAADAGLVQEARDSGAVVAIAELPSTPDAGITPPGIKEPLPIVLTPKVIQAVVQRNRGNVMGCFELHRGELLADQGTANVTFIIMSSGRVAAAKSELSGQVGACLESRFRALKFPRHRDKEVSLTLPLVYEVKR